MNINIRKTTIHLSTKTGILYIDDILDGNNIDPNRIIEAKAEFKYNSPYTGREESLVIFASNYAKEEVGMLELTGLKVVNFMKKAVTDEVFIKKKLKDDLIKQKKLSEDKKSLVNLVKDLDKSFTDKEINFSDMEI